MATEFEYRQLRLPRGTTRNQARMALSVAATYGGWELATYRLFSDGRRMVEVRRRKDPSLPQDLPEMLPF